MIIDTHSHCYWQNILPHIDEVIYRMKEKNVVQAVQIGCDIETSEQAIDLAKRFPGLFLATVGHHPETAQNEVLDEMFLDKFERLIVENRDFIVAVGECGFDFHYLDGSLDGKNPVDLMNLSQKAQVQIENQKKWWIAQWNIAQKYNLPLIIHSRDARKATLEFMKENAINRVVMHCFSEDWEFANELLQFSSEIYFSFSGILTYKNAQSIQEAAKKIPLNCILIETDAPFLSPQVVRGTVNEPGNTRYVFEKLCELRNEPSDQIEKVIYENSVRFYSLQKNTQL